MMLLEEVEIVSNQVIAPRCYRLILSSPRIDREAMPGQFLHIRCSDGYDPLLRRPFSIHSRVDKDTFSVLYKVVGKGTTVLSRKKSGETLNILGPLGKGFQIPSRRATNLTGQQALLVGGGIGVAPLLFLAQELQRRKVEITFLLGASTKDQLLSLSDFKNLGAKIKVTTEDGSYGVKGYVTDIFEKALLDLNRQLLLSVFASGPFLMLKRLVTISRIYNIPSQVSLEEKMACGLGACFSCVVLTREGYKRVCRDGPVFEGEMIDWEG